MTTSFNDCFQAEFRAKVVGEPSLVEPRYCYPGAIEGYRVEGIDVEVFPSHGDAWSGSFADGILSPNAVSFAGCAPSGTQLLVVARGDSYIVDAMNPRRWFELPLIPVMGVLCVPSHEVIIAWDFVRMACLDGEGIRWRTPSISWDGISDVVQDGERLAATVWDAPTGAFKTAWIAISDGTVSGGTSSDLYGIVG